MNNVRLVCAGLIERCGDIVLVGKFKDGKMIYDFPSGKIKVGEDYSECMVREVREECGLDVLPNHLVGIYNRPKTDNGNNLTAYVFNGRVFGGDLEPLEDFTVAKYFGVNDIRRMNLAGNLRSSYILKAVDDYLMGLKYPLSLFSIVK